MNIKFHAGRGGTWPERLVQAQVGCNRECRPRSRHAASRGLMLHWSAISPETAEIDKCLDTVRHECSISHREIAHVIALQAMHVIVSSTGILAVGRKQAPVVRVATVVFEFIRVQVYVPLFHLHVCLLPFRGFQDEFGFVRIELARTRNEPVAMFLLQVDSNDIFTVLRPNQGKQVSSYIPRQVVGGFLAQYVVPESGIETYSFIVHCLNRSPGAKAIQHLSRDRIHAAGSKPPAGPYVHDVGITIIGCRLDFRCLSTRPRRRAWFKGNARAPTPAMSRKNKNGPPRPVGPIIGRPPRATSQYLDRAYNPGRLWQGCCRGHGCFRKRARSGSDSSVVSDPSERRRHTSARRPSCRRNQS